MSIIELSQLGQDLFYFSDLTWAHPLTHPGANRWGCLHKSEIFKQNWTILIRSKFIRFLVIWHDPILQPTHPPNNTPNHQWGGLHRFHIFKQNRIISICSRLIAFLVIWGFPPWGWVWVGGWRYGWENRIERIGFVLLIFLL